MNQETQALVAVAMRQDTKMIKKAVIAEKKRLSAKAAVERSRIDKEQKQLTENYHAATKVNRQRKRDVRDQLQIALKEADATVLASFGAKKERLAEAGILGIDIATKDRAQIGAL